MVKSMNSEFQNWIREKSKIHIWVHLEEWRLETSQHLPQFWDLQYLYFEYSYTIILVLDMYTNILLLDPQLRCLQYLKIFEHTKTGYGYICLEIFRYPFDKIPGIGI